MKRNILIGLTLIFFLSGFAQIQEVTKVLENVDNLVITTNKNVTTIVAERDGDENNFIYQVAVGTKEAPATWFFDYPFFSHKQSKEKKSVCEFAVLKDIYWGWDFNYGKKGNVKNCFEVGVGEVVGVTFSPFRKGPSFNVGLGFGMRRLLARNGYQFFSEHNNLMIVPAGQEIEIEKSRTDSWTFSVPVMISQNIYRHFAISVGAWINFNTYVRGETEYLYDSFKYKETYKNLNQRFCTVDLVGVIGIKNGIGVYGRWCPMSLFDDGRGPEFKTASLGVMINF